MHKELTAKGEATRNRIVEGAAVVLREKGVSAATLDDVMARTQTSKSQLFHYFPAGKDELLLAVAHGLGRGVRPARRAGQRDLPQCGADPRAGRGAPR